MLATTKKSAKPISLEFSINHLKDLYMKQVSVINERVVEAINSGEDLAAFFNDLFKCRQMLGEALSHLTSCFIAAREKGLVVIEEDTPVTQFLKGSKNRILFELTKSANTDPVLIANQVTGLIASINAARKNGGIWSIPESPEKEPTPVTVVSMPKRTLTTSVVRGATGNIVGSTQTESFV